MFAMSGSDPLHDDHDSPRKEALSLGFREFLIFALVVMAQTRARATRDAEERKRWKIRLVRLMYESGHGPISY